MRHQRGQVLIILFLGTMFFGGTAAGLGWIYGGNNFRQLSKQLKQVVPEPERRKPLAQILGQLQSSSQAYDQSHQRQVRKLLAILERHDAKRAEMDQQLAELDALNQFSRRAMLDLRYRLRDSVSAEEWTKLFPPPLSGQPE